MWRESGATGVAMLALFIVCRADALEQTPAPSPSGQAVPGQVRPTAPAAGRGAPAAVTGTARLRGRVAAADTGQPLRRARITVSVTATRETRTAATDDTLSVTATRETRTVATDEQGRYEVSDLPAGRYTPRVSMTGYLDTGFGQRGPNYVARPIDLADAQVFEADFHMMRGSVVVIHVTDDFGEPLSDVQAVLERYRYVRGERALAPVGSGLTLSNDLGEVRLYGVPPGEYYVSARITNALPLDTSERPLSYVPTYYPRTTSIADAQRVSVAPGQQQDVIIGLLAARSATVSGRIQRSNGAAMVPGRFELVKLGVAGGYSSSLVRVRPDSVFELPNVAPGEYSLVAGASLGLSPAPGDEFASMPITVAGEDLRDLLVVTSPGAMVTGRVVFDSGIAVDFKPGAFVLFPGLMPLMSSGRVSWHDDWTFEAAQVTGKRQAVALARTPSNGWFLKAVMLDAKDVTDTVIDFDTVKDMKGLDIILTQRRSGLGGTVADDRGRPVTDYAAILFSQDEAGWTSQSRFIAAGRPDQQGHFTISGMPPGRYLIAAVDELDAGEERDPDLLKRLAPGAQRIVLADGETASVTLKLTSR